MSSRRGFRAWHGLYCVVALLTACSTTPQSPGPYDEGGPGQVSAQGDAGTLAPCSFASQCASNFCATFGSDYQGYCSAACTTDTDCPATAICSASHACAPQCTAASTCQGECACASGLVCSAGKGCVAPAEVGMPCSQDAECKSQNCGSRAHICDVPVGSPCTVTNCEACEVFTNGNAYCSRPCTTSADCNGYGGVCDVGYCAPQCSEEFDPSCAPDRCDGIDDGTTISWFCICGVDNCTFSIQPGAFGSSCSSGSQCQSNDCVSFGVELAGVCAQACSSDADCPAGGACIACVDGDAGGVDGDAGGIDGGCSNQCFPTCDADSGGGCAAGTCRSGSRVAGGSASICDPHVSLGGECLADADCASGRCSRGYGANTPETCIPSAGLPPGTPCTSDHSDCASGACCNSKCC
jgi:hypothetical protein